MPSGASCTTTTDQLATATAGGAVWERGAEPPQGSVVGERSSTTGGGAGRGVLLRAVAVKDKRVQSAERQCTGSNCVKDAL